jgi:hypothetical protein
MLSFRRKIINFIKSFSWHIYSGLPKSGQKMINERYKICKSCEFFDQKLSQCMICGCNINNKDIFMNKLAWKDQTCPKGKW